METQEPLRRPGITLCAFVGRVDHRHRAGAHPWQFRPGGRRSLSYRVPESHGHTGWRPNSRSAGSHRNPAANPNPDRVPDPASRHPNPVSSAAQRRAGHCGQPVPQPSNRITHGGSVSQRHGDQLAAIERHAAGCDANRKRNGAAPSDRVPGASHGDQHAGLGLDPVRNGNAEADPRGRKYCALVVIMDN